MLITPIYKGQGLGNQLANIITVRCIALDKGYDFGVVFPERFKGHFFKDIDLQEAKGLEVDVEGQEPTTLPDGYTYYREQMIGDGDYDPAIFDLKDNTVVHGLLQGEGYFENHRDEIDSWLKVEPIEIPDDVCVINFRGGEYVGVREFFLPKSYWDNAIERMLEKNPDMRFEVHTDDPETARQFFPNYPIIRDIEINWRSIRHAKYLILSNSSFALLPAWLNQEAYILAPKFFARHNEGYWFLRQNFMKSFNYL